VLRAPARPLEAAAAQRGVDYLESLRQSFVTSGFEFNVKPGTPGISRFERRIVPIELRWALDYDRHLFAHADRLDLSAGRLDLADFASATRYGQILAAGPPGPGGSQQPGASGIMPGIGYEGRYWRIDAGHLPGSFPVTYAVGGVRYEARALGVDWRAELARRPVTGTLISFSGVRDPDEGRELAPKQHRAIQPAARCGAACDARVSCWAHRATAPDTLPTSGSARTR
jgi:hypothetical protein